MARLNTYDISWTLDEALCPCDVHFLRYLETARHKGSAIFHFGTGGHHSVGLGAHASGAGHAVLGMTASPQEHAAYEQLIIEQPGIGRDYKVLFGDIYQLDARLLPEFDIVTLFHVGEFRNEKNDAYGAMTDEALVRMLVAKLKGPRLVLFYAGSFAFDIAEAIANKLTAEGKIEPAGRFESLRLYRGRVS